MSSSSSLEFSSSLTDLATIAFSSPFPDSFIPQNDHHQQRYMQYWLEQQLEEDTKKLQRIIEDKDKQIQKLKEENKELLIEKHERTKQHNKETIEKLSKWNKWDKKKNEEIKKIMNDHCTKFFEEKDIDKKKEIHDNYERWWLKEMKTIEAKHKEIVEEIEKKKHERIEKAKKKLKEELEEKRKEFWENINKESGDNKEIELVRNYKQWFIKKFEDYANENIKDIRNEINPNNNQTIYHIRPYNQPDPSSIRRWTSVDYYYYLSEANYDNLKIGEYFAKKYYQLKCGLNNNNINAVPLANNNNNNTAMDIEEAPINNRKRARGSDDEEIGEEKKEEETK